MKKTILIISSAKGGYVAQKLKCNTGRRFGLLISGSIEDERLKHQSVCCTDRENRRMPFHAIESG